ncbi:MAG: chorismate synthase [Candidatus Omnitrophica bacterium]|nr:chorismate synthase [Candidatus Omnitrophota bacterium]MBU1996091.1 chorismate synthase [Candidatus Omnitrophota bacterium]MBU4334856.1 chorismate synthase [Candidatus Omnitrophota bacterium]
MSGNTFGKIFKITTFGESHGPAIGVVIDGVPPNLKVSVSDIQHELNRRRPGQSDITTQRDEHDIAEILSGIFEGKTTGCPIAIVIHNKDHNSNDYTDIKDVFRPGHADHTFFEKYGIRDFKGGGRSSGRETAARVAAGAIAKQILRDHGISIVAYTLSIAGIRANNIDTSVIEKNPVRAPDLEAAKLMIEKINEARENNDSVGGVIEAIVHGCPAGLGDPVFDKLTARLSHAIMSIGATRGIEFGTGFEATSMLGSEHNDKLYWDGDKIRSTTNNAGGISGGISNGANIVLRVAIKPTSSISQAQQSVTVSGKNTNLEIKGRHDPCICPRVVCVIEAMIAITLLDSLLIQKATS